MNKLSKDNKDRLLGILFDSRMSGLFGDGLEEEYVMDGTKIVGLNEMSDKELVEEYEGIIDDKSDELLTTCKFELSLDTIMKK